MMRDNDVSTMLHTDRKAVSWVVFLHNKQIVWYCGKPMDYLPKKSHRRNSSIIHGIMLFANTCFLVCDVIFVTHKFSKIVTKLLICTIIICGYEKLT